MVKLLLDRGAKIDAKTRVRVQLMYLLTLIFRKQVCFLPLLLAQSWLCYFHRCSLLENDC